LAKKFSILLFPDENSQPVRVRLPAWALWLGMLTFLVGTGLFAFLGYRHFTLAVDHQELVQLCAEQNSGRQDLQHLAINLQELRVELQTLQQGEARVRQLAGLGANPKELPVAIGGVPEVDSSDDFDDILKQINQLQIELELRRQSQEEVRNLLNDKVSLNRATPRGWPARGWITSYFGKRMSPFSGSRVMHEGLDIAANTGTPIYATADGVVARVSYSPSYGKSLVIDHGYGYRTIFGHTSKILVKAGDRIHRGDKIALVGNTGRSTGSHVHYELRLNGIPIDPRKTL